MHIIWSVYPYESIFTRGILKILVERANYEENVTTESKEGANEREWQMNGRKQYRMEWEIEIDRERESERQGEGGRETTFENNKTISFSISLSLRWMHNNIYVHSDMGIPFYTPLDGLSGCLKFSLSN